MSVSKSLIRQSHFLGTKIRNLRKNNHLTMEDLSARCVRINPEYAPSVSYLSMIERGKRVPSIDMLEVIAEVFQKDPAWFLDDEPELEAITPNKGNRGGINGMALEPSFLFSNDILQIAIPEMLSQTGITGRQFAHLLIRAHQENHQNHFPDLERAAEEVGLKRLNLSVEDLIDIAKSMGLDIRWVDRAPQDVIDELGVNAKQLITSFMEPPSTIYLNKRMRDYPTRLKYDLSVYIGHRVLHSSDAMNNVLSIGHQNNWEQMDSPVSNSEL
ncbi:MerR family transcriptional regulator, partial [Vibrio parahaemolyticus]